MRLRKLFALLLFVALFTAIAYAAMGTVLVERVRNLGGSSGGRLLQVTQDVHGNIHLLRERDGLERISLSKDTKRENLSRYLPEAFVPQELFMADEQLFLTGYQQDEQGQYSLVIYARQQDGSFALALQESSRNASLAQLQERVQISAFSYLDGWLRFFVKVGDQITAYSMQPYDMGLQVEMTVRYEGVIGGGLVRGDTLYLQSAEGKLLILTETASQPVESDYLYSSLTATEDGFAFVDAATGTVLHFDATTELYTLSCEDLPCDSRRVSDICPGESRTLLLENGQRLYSVTDDNRMQDMTAKLYPPNWQSVLILLAVAVVIALLSAVAYYLFCVRRSLYFPVVIRSAMILCLLLGLCTSFVVQRRVVPEVMAGTRQIHLVAMETALSALGNGRDLSEQEQRAILDRSNLSGLQFLILDQDEQNNWRIISSTHSQYPGGALMQAPGMAGWLIDVADDTGQAVTSGYLTEGARVYYAAMARQGTVYLCYGDATQTELAQQVRAQKLAVPIYAGAVIAVALALILLATVMRGVRRVQKALSLMAQGKYDLAVVHNSGDELQALSETVNGLAFHLGRRQSDEAQRDSTYLQFVPQQVLSLMGVTSVDEVTRTTISEQDMTVMNVLIRFPEHLYHGDPQTLFVNLNEVIARTSRIISQHGGTIYNFNSEGYDAVFENETQEAISAAVEIRQEILGLNSERQRAGLEEVSLRIAIDRGNVIMGVVGDDSHIVPAAISSHLKTTQTLIELSETLDANILCTMAASEQSQGYHLRYIGKTLVGQEKIRVYEIFDGDSYDCRREKEKNRSQFSEGVLTLYTGDYAKAKRIFMDIARYHSADGVTRQYLYLADKYEQEAPEEILLK